MFERESYKGESYGGGFFGGERRGKGNIRGSFGGLGKSYRLKKLYKKLFMLITIFKEVLIEEVAAMQTLPI